MLPLLVLVSAWLLLLNVVGLLSFENVLLLVGSQCWMDYMGTLVYFEYWVCHGRTSSGYYCIGSI